MYLNEQVLVNILDVSKDIFQIVSEFNPRAIFKDKIFLVDGEKVSIENIGCNDSSYYFEHRALDGVIIKKKNEKEYCIKATVEYIIGKERNGVLPKLEYMIIMEKFV